MDKLRIKYNKWNSSRVTRRASEDVSMTVKETSGIANATKFFFKSLFLIALGLFIIFPFYYMLSISLMSKPEVEDPGGIPMVPGDSTFGNYLTVFFRGYLMAFGFSVVVMLTNVLLKVAVCILIGYSFAMYEFKFKKTIWNLLIMSMMIPEVALIASQYDIIISLGIDHGILVFIGLSAPFVAQVFTIYMFRNGFETIPNSVKEASAIDGISKTQFFFKIAIPMTSSTLWTVIILTAFASWNSYIWPSLVLGGSTHWNTITLWLFNASVDEVNGAQLKNLQMASAVLTVLPTIIVYMIFKKKIDSTVAASGGVKG